MQLLDYSNWIRVRFWWLVLLLISVGHHSAAMLHLSVALILGFSSGFFAVVFFSGMVEETCF
jgi:hypothetical protein